MNITKDTVNNYLDLQEEIEKVCWELLSWYNSQVKPVEGYRFLDEVDVSQDGIEFSGEEWRRGESENHYFTLPIKILYDDSVKGKLLKEEEDKKKKMTEVMRKIVKRSVRMAGHCDG